MVSMERGVRQDERAEPADEAKAAQRRASQKAGLRKKGTDNSDRRNSAGERLKKACRII